MIMATTKGKRGCQDGMFTGRENKKEKGQLCISSDSGSLIAKALLHGFTLAHGLILLEAFITESVVLARVADYFVKRWGVDCHVARRD